MYTSYYSKNYLFAFELLMFIAEEPLNSQKTGVWGLIELLCNVWIHFSPAHVQSLFEDVDRWRSNNESWQLVPGFNDPHGESDLPSVQPETSEM